MVDKNITDTLSDAVKERLHNRVYSFILTSIIAANWQHIIIIIKSKRNIYATLNDITATSNFLLLYFFAPIIVGIALSFIMPFLTRLIEVATAKQHAIIKNSHLIGQAELEIELEKRKKKASKINLETVANDNKASNQKYQTEFLISQSKTYYKWLQGLLKSYENIGTKIENEQDLKKLLLELEKNEAVYDEAILPDFKKIMYEVKAVHEKETT